MKNITILLISIVFIATSCGLLPKDEPYPAIKPTTENLLVYKIRDDKAVQKHWIGQYYIGGYSAFPDCINDNEFTLKIDGSFIEPEGATKCDPSSPEIADSGTWSIKHFKSDSIYSNKDTLLLSSGTLGYVKASLDKLTLDSLVSTFTLTPEVLSAYGLPAGTKIVFKAKSF